MEIIILDGACMTDKEAAHAYIAKVMRFPAHYGKNLDALADCLVEAAADEACSRLECKDMLTNRFSPGYADLDLSVGRYVVKATGADKLLGVRFTDSGLMTPKKTVSAIIGIRGDKK